MAVIFKQGMTFLLRYNMQGEDGSKQVIQEKFDDYQAVLKRKMEVEEHPNSEQLLITKETEVLAFLQEYANKRGVRIWGSSMYQKNLSSIYNYLSKVIQHEKICDVDIEVAENIMSQLKQLPAVGKRNQKADAIVPLSMVKCSLNLCKNAFDYLVATEVIITNPFHSIEIILPKSSKIKIPWTMDYVKALFNHCDNARMYILLHLFFSTGLTLHEILGLTWDDVFVEGKDCFILSKNIMKRLNKVVAKQYENQIITRFSNFTNTCTEMVLMKKQEQPFRVSIPIAVAKLLKELKLQQTEFDLNNPQNLVLMLYDGRPYDLRVVEKDYLLSRKNADLPNVTLLSFKHFGRKKNENGVRQFDLFYEELTDALYVLYKECEMQPMLKNKISVTLKNELLKNKEVPQGKSETDKFIEQIKNDPELKYKLLLKLMQSK